MMRRVLLFAAVILTALLLQSTVFAQIKLLGVEPELMYLVTILVAILEGPQEGAVVGFAGGMAQDFLLNTPKGHHGAHTHAARLLDGPRAPIHREPFAAAAHDARGRGHLRRHGVLPGGGGPAGSARACRSATVCGSVSSRPCTVPSSHRSSTPSCDACLRGPVRRGWCGSNSWKRHRHGSRCSRCSWCSCSRPSARVCGSCRCWRRRSIANRSSSRASASSRPTRCAGRSSRPTGCRS